MVVKERLLGRCQILIVFVGHEDKRLRIFNWVTASRNVGIERLAACLHCTQWVESTPTCSFLIDPWIFYLLRQNIGTRIFISEKQSAYSWLHVN